MLHNFTTKIPQATIMSSFQLTPGINVSGKNLFKKIQIGEIHDLLMCSCSINYRSVLSTEECIGSNVDSSHFCKSKCTLVNASGTNTKYWKISAPTKWRPIDTIQILHTPAVHLKQNRTFQQGLISFSKNYASSTLFASNLRKHQLLLWRMSKLTQLISECKF